MSRSPELEALEWVRRTHDPDFSDWDAHLAWLEADPANAAAFDRMLLAVDAATMSLTATPDAAAANDNPATGQMSRRRGLGWGMGIAAALAGVIGVGTLLHQPSQAPAAAVYTTAPGEQRTVRLVDGTKLAMNGDTAIRIAAGSGRSIRIDRGELYLDVVHDAANPLQVGAGDVVLRDVGTRFNVRRDRDGLTVAVQEGAVDYQPGDGAIRLTAGQELRRNGHKVTLGRSDPAAIGGWRSGRLVYRDAQLATVAADLTRATGETIAVDPVVADVRFTGVLTVEPDHARVLHRLGAVADVRVERYGGAWRVSAHGN